MTASPRGEGALLEARREFLLRSLDDLERERADGNVEAADYERLRDDYTARAAAVLRALEEGRDSHAPAPRRRARSSAVVVVLVAFAVTAGVLLGRSLGERVPGESLTGNEQLDPRARLDRLAGAVEERPDDAVLRRSYARALLDAGEVAEALREYDAAAALDPADAESRAHAAWIVFLAGLSEDARERVDEAVAVDPEYADARFFRGAILSRLGDRAQARAELERYLELAPDGRYAEDARTLLANLEESS